MTDTLEGFLGTPGPYRWVEHAFDGKPSGNFHDLPALVSDFGKVCDFGNDERYYPSEGSIPTEADARLLAKSYELALFAQRVANTTLTPSSDTKASDMAATFVELKREARAILNSIIGEQL